MTRPFRKFSATSDFVLNDSLKKGNFDLIYANTITNGAALEALSALDCKVITHVHEMGYWIGLLGQKNLDQVKFFTDQYIAASFAVKNHLVEQCGIPADKIDVVQAFIPTNATAACPKLLTELRKQLGIRDESFIVAGSGLETWRKGKDLFVELASKVLVHEMNRPVYFVWVGGWENAFERQKIEKVVTEMKLEENVHFVGQVDNPLDYFSLCNVFAMVSREDPYPLVCLEAAALGKPVLCFREAGGMPEFVENDAGISFDYLDIAGMAQQVLHLMDDKSLLKSLGDCAKNKVRERHDVSVGAPKILDIIRKTVGSR